MQLVVMGVAGAGKTTIGRLLAHELGWAFIDADDLHPAANIAKMQAGIALDDADRAPWLAAIRATLQAHAAAQTSCVLACSALKQQYRTQLMVAPSVRFVYLKLDPATAQQRITQRSDHFMPAGLVQSQFAALEEPDQAVIVDATTEPVVLVQQIRQALEI